MKKTITILQRTLIAVCLLTAFNRVQAQPFNLDDRIQPVELNLVDYKKEDAKRKGRINITNVTQAKDTLYYFVKGLSMYSPTYFSITTADQSVPVKVKLCKNNWRESARSGETGDKGSWSTKFKTEGDFGIMVVPSAKGAKYTLLTWVGDEAKEIGMASAFKTADDKAGSTSGNFFTKNRIIMAAGVVLAGIIIFLLIKRKK